MSSPYVDFNSMSDLEVEVKAIEMTIPLPASAAPIAGNFYSTQHLPGTANEWPPLPENILGVSVWSLGDGFYLLDDTNVDYDALAAAKAAAQPAASPIIRRSMMSSLSTVYAYNYPVYLTNMAASFAYDGSVTASFSIAGGTNFVPYDILMTTNLATPINSWTWLGIGYTSNYYTFTEQPVDLGFYILAKPQRTMVIAWGIDNKGQCDVPSGLTNALAVTGGAYHSIALLNNYSLVAWGDNSYGQTNIPSGLTNVAMITANGFHDLALRSDGTVAIWGDWNWNTTNYYSVTLPTSLTNIVAIAAGWNHDLAVNSNGTVIAWGYPSTSYATVPTNLPPAQDVAAGMNHSVTLLTNGTVVAWGNNYLSQGETNVPAGLSNVVAIAAGDYHTLALKSDGTVAAWGAGVGNLFVDHGQSTVPVGLSNVVAIAAGGYHSMALKSDGTVVMWGDMTTPGFPLNHIIGIGFGWIHALVLRTGNTAPLITSQPTNQYVPTGATVSFTVQAIDLAGVQYQWQFDGVNITGATNATLTLTNVQTTQQGGYQVVITDSLGSVVSTAATLTLWPPPQPPQIISITPALGTVWATNYTINIAQNLFVVTATNTDLSDYPLSYQWSFNGTNIAGATNAIYYLPLYPWFSSLNDPYSHIYPPGFTFSNGIAALEGAYTVTITDAAGSTNLSWNVKIALPGMVAAWGDDAYGECDRPVTLTNTLALAAGGKRQLKFSSDDD